MRILSFIAFLMLVVLPARAENLASAPGWTLARITEQKQEENVYSEARVYFSLKPPDARPAISIDSNTADRLRSGGATAEGVYSGQGAPKKDDEEYVYGTHGNGIQMAETVNSTLTVDEGRKEVPVKVQNTRNKP